MIKLDIIDKNIILSFNFLIDFSNYQQLSFLSDIDFFY